MSQTEQLAAARKKARLRGSEQDLKLEELRDPVARVPWCVCKECGQRHFRKGGA